MLSTLALTDGSRGYRAFSYLIAADDGQGNIRARPVTDTIWRCFLDCATDEDAYYIGVAAYQRANSQVAIAASRRAAEAGDTRARSNLGFLLESLDPPDLTEGRSWFTRAAQAGRPQAREALRQLEGGWAAGPTQPITTKIT